ncbi:MAG: AtpZ/AtpI family protein [Bryobacter sp.]|nr:AtpZ/AtpI family protein [Bryobacter sp.]
MGRAAVFLGLPFFLLVAMGGGYYAGKWVDAQYGTTQMNFVGLLVGMGVGLYEVLRQVKRLEKK